MTAPDDLGIRRATADDADAVADVYLAAHHLSLPWLRLAHTDEQVRGWIARHVVAELETWVAAREEQIVAILVLDLPARMLDHLHVAPRHQGRGIGDRLLRIAKQRSDGHLRLYTFQRNERARAFYEARGFIVVDVNDGSRNEEGEPDVQYEWRAPGLTGPA